MNHYFKDIDGWFDFADIYNEAIATAQDGDTLLETGTWFGKSAVYLGVEALNSGKQLNIVTVDNNEIYEHCPNGGVEDRTIAIKKNLKPLKNVRFIDGDSLEVANQFKDGSLHLIFLDAMHTKEFLSKELRAWWPKLKKGGIFAGHDYILEWPGVIIAVKEFAQQHGLTIKVRGSSWQLC